MKKRAADYDMKTFYLDFKQKVNKQVKEIEDKIGENIAKAVKYRSWLTACKGVLLNAHNIDLNNYPREMIDGEYCSGTKDFKVKASIAYNKAPAGKRNEIIKLLAYLNILTEGYKLNIAKNALNREANLKFSEYREMLFNYYNKIHELLIKGDAYTIANSVGTMYLEKKVVPFKRKTIDFNETNKRKKELTEAGIELYDDTKPKIAKQKHKSISKYITTILFSSGDNSNSSSNKSFSLMQISFLTTYFVSFIYYTYIFKSLFAKLLFSS